ncbi:MAG: class I SAM-dependent methyltransferase [Promethearchaeati archaeon SRVP18_Atabeyarchaeia-1]
MVRGVLMLGSRISDEGRTSLNIITSYRIARALRRGLRFIAVQTAIEEGYQRMLSKPTTIDQLCASENYAPGARDKIRLFLDSLVCYNVMKREKDSRGTTRYIWACHKDHVKEAKTIKEEVDNMLAHKYCGELLRGQHFELAKNWKHVVRGESETEISRAREMIAISIGLRAKLMEEGRKRAISFVGIKPGMSVIDLGCGSGTSTIQIAQAVGSQGHVVGLELDENLFSEAVVRYQELPASDRKEMAEVEFLMGDARDGALDKTGKDFDVATTFLFWHYIREDDYNKVIMNIRNVLGENGCLAGMEPMHLREGDLVHGEWTGTVIPEFTHYPNLQQFRKALWECGFEKFKLSKMLMTFRADRA